MVRRISSLVLPGSSPVTAISVAALSLAVGLVGQFAPASAASSKRQAPEAVVAAKQVTPSPLIAVVSINEQKVTIWSADGQVARSPVSTGASGHRTPTGVFSVIGKERYHESNLYSAAPMPFMQRITWSGIAMHAGNLPGYAASHGCIRMPDDFAQRLYGMTRMGMRVIIGDRDISPFPIAHAALPSPTFVREAQIANMVTGAPSVTLATEVPPGRMQLGGPGSAAEKIYNPMERGKFEQGYAKNAALEAQADAHALLEIAQVRGFEARKSADAVRTAEASLASVRAGRDKATEIATNSMATDEERVRGGLAKATLDAAYAAGELRRDALRSEAFAADAAAFEAAAEAKSAVVQRDALEHAARIAERALEPVSVFVSRKNHRVYVRQGFEPVFEADIEIADADTPLGTHVFTAVAAPVDTGPMRWVAVTVPDGVLADASKVRDNRSPKANSSSGLQTVAMTTSERSAAPLPPTAANALARVKFSEEVLQRISEKLWTGASLMISDYGVSHETGKGTDFVILTRSAGE